LVIGALITVAIAQDTGYQPLAPTYGQSPDLGPIPTVSMSELPVGGAQVPSYGETTPCTESTLLPVPSPTQTYVEIAPTTPCEESTLLPVPVPAPTTPCDESTLLPEPAPAYTETVAPYTASSIPTTPFDESTMLPNPTKLPSPSYGAQPVPGYGGDSSAGYGNQPPSLLPVAEATYPSKAYKLTYLSPSSADVPCDSEATNLLPVPTTPGGYQSSPQLPAGGYDSSSPAAGSSNGEWDEWECDDEEYYSLNPQAAPTEVPAHYYPSLLPESTSLPTVSEEECADDEELVDDENCDEESPAGSYPTGTSPERYSGVSVTDLLHAATPTDSGPGGYATPTGYAGSQSTLLPSAQEPPIDSPIIAGAYSRSVTAALLVGAAMVLLV
jgi:hypothetical protein